MHCERHPTAVAVGEQRVWSYFAFPWQIILCLAATVQRNQEMCARVSVGERETSIRHLLPGGSCSNGQRLVGYIHI